MCLVRRSLLTRQTRRTSCLVRAKRLQSPCIRPDKLHTALQCRRAALSPTPRRSAQQWLRTLSP